MVDHPYWVTHSWNSSLSPIPLGLVDKFMPAKVRRRRVLKRVMEQISGLVNHNVENLRWPVYQSLDQTFRRFGADLDQRLADTISATHGAIQAALARRKEHAESVAEEKTRLESAVAGLSELQAGLRQG